MGMDGKKHLRLAKYPGFWERTISVYSLGKVKKGGAELVKCFSYKNYKFSD